MVYKKRQIKSAQVSIEYLVIIGFVTFVVIGILGVALIYSGAIKDKIRMVQTANFANKIISTSESVFYAGEPSKATIMAYLPKGVKEIEIAENSLFISVQTSSGINKVAFSSNVPISGTLSNDYGLKKIQILAGQNQVDINQV